ncbi:hypothetical protein OG871_36300 [Kitasatospora sp. NBC_00374]|uniref:hypothetical protein n=1 Tax=Kitasatospora sp. NBC_00374 TaxID=2975964 RepID=UPI0030E13345
MFTDADSAGSGGGPTPAELRDLQAQVDALARDVVAMRERLKQSPGLPRGVRGALSGAVDDALAQVARRIGGAAGELARVRAAQGPGSCTAWWGICPRCGPTLRTRDGRSWCRECSAGWGYDRTQGPCGEPAVFLAMDAQGGTVVVCAAHGRHMQERLDGGLLLAIPTS